MTISSDSSAPANGTAPANAAAPEAAGFADLNLPASLLRAIADLGFTEPTAIQAQAIPALLSGRDITGVAQTGTGKTAAFGLPLLAAVDPQLGRVQALVLAPTRELAMQTAEAIESFAKHMHGVEVIAIYGGSPFVPQQRALARGAQIVVGTPGRVIDHIERGTLHLEDVKYLVLDEGDEMLRMGFAEDVDKIFSFAPVERQVALFSATMPPAIRRVANQHMTNPVEIATSRQSSTVTSVKQSYAVVPFRHKAGALARVLAVTEAEAAIVFVRTRGAAEEVGSALVERGISAAYISGDVAQGEREKIVERLRSGALNVLVATDVAARGLDVDRIGLVVNFDAPSEPEIYVHRIGRTGRAGRTGEALTFVTPSEQHRLRQIERLTRTPLIEMTLPSPADVSAHRVQQLLGKVNARTEAGRLELYRESVAVFLAKNPEVDIEDLVASLAALAVGDDGPQARTGHGEDLDEALARARMSPERPERGGRNDSRDSRGENRNGPRGGAASRRTEGGTRYRVAVGASHGAQPGAIVGALTNEGGLTGKDLGKIDIFPSFSLVEISGNLTQDAFDRISRARVAGQPLRIRLDDGPAPRTNHAPSRPSGSSTGPREHRAPSTERKTYHRNAAY
ncbi:DEAD/DEAH box helicase [Pengzhenrongella sicca]|uniref:RNA helicase n=1 Tax=Pengzhenrongella sicca TaxID=2819238 RepID=A0A8A4Z7I5_9MICO|nr:DEAD/DEAH box helicase [Pengzhenrongella sicca]QTE27860.1 DEAD/DEAH box helicase [Pengzhenrongella sicca]